MAIKYPRAGTEQQRLQLKAATRALIELNGGLESASCVTRVAKSQLAAYASINEATAYAPLDVILDLEAAVGRPLATDALATIQHLAVVPMALPVVTTRDWHGCLGTLSKEIGDAMQKMGRALASDGVVTAREINDDDLKREVREVVGAALYLLRLVESVSDGESCSVAG